MRIRVINPNTSASMTETIAASAHAAAAPDTVIEAVTPAMGPASIEGHYDEALAVPGVLTEVARGVADQVDGFVLACFGDPGMDAARELAQGRPVIGIAQAAMHVAALSARGFAVVTTLSRTAGRAWDLARSYGFGDRCREVLACEVPVLAVDSAEDMVADLAREALTHDGVEAIVLGCAGMAEMAARVSAEPGAPVIDGIGAGVELVETMVRNGVRGSARGEYAAPLPKMYVGLLEPFTVS
ncbi:MAG: aspartate/glutamate racemase family protein [Acidipropionibacterium jensenii]|uniref:aspartate/glutamate racemase family protein n=1 Tax=Acidipropionibacterium jensenii TaxID=1749 RepID=UPI002649E116|nr:aspartate/glutamate racemase family protein [Acidipropionibacterium jensenii]MDN6514287.1 aspartate/glutamate racemase family protein [Acidipropionibacterium jensenii]